MMAQTISAQPMNQERKKALDPTARFATILFLVGFGYLLFAILRPSLSAPIWSAISVRTLP